MDVVPYVNVNLQSDSTDIALIRSNCGQLVKDASWKMIFAKDQAEFDSIWKELKEDLSGFNWTELVEFDIVKNKPLVEERQKALEAK